MGSCFWPSGDVADNYFACPNSHVCCEAGDYCLAGGLCEDQYDYFYRGGCTSKEWSGDSACPQYCMNQTVPWLDSMVRKVSVLNCVLDANGTNSKEFACVNEHYESVCQDLANANAPFEVFEGVCDRNLSRTPNADQSIDIRFFSGYNIILGIYYCNHFIWSQHLLTLIIIIIFYRIVDFKLWTSNSILNIIPLRLILGRFILLLFLPNPNLFDLIYTHRPNSSRRQCRLHRSNHCPHRFLPPPATKEAKESQRSSRCQQQHNLTKPTRLHQLNHALDIHVIDLPKSFNTLSPPPISVPSRPSSAYSAELHGNDKHFSELHGNDRQVSEMPNWEWLARDRRFRYELDGDSDIVSAPLRMGAKAAGNAAARPSTPATGSSTPAQEGGRVDGGSATDNKDPKDKSKEEKRFSLNLGDERL
ncbi:hypothetical protein B0T17DRAFT_646824 [Bombardia bombarda]|uniref:Uncharacterized protein n=1 Tax=Bombardia bombarda TaxID=252184 RepID=A0AA39WGX6_9PEZI|nr:hypothetical protein B0T17DRAFT_646824 [Bombardia bombarda]